MSRVAEELAFGRDRGRRTASWADKDLWERTPTLNKLREELGAEIVSFRRAVIYERDVRGYAREIAAITIDGGKMTCHLRDLEAAQKAIIEAEIAAANFPKSVSAYALPAELQDVDPKTLFIFRAHHESEGLGRKRVGENQETRYDILAVHQRVDHSDGTKSYYWWSYWDDGIWRKCKPDGLLPLFNLHRLKDAGGVVYVHEGAKAARAAQEIADGRRPKHPWSNDLKGTIHLGWAAGAKNSHCVDWEPLKHFAQVVVVADNDPHGVDAVSEISRRLGRPMEVVRFIESKFPPGFDLADEWPDHAEWRSKEGEYIGPTIENLTFPATWATEPFGKAHQIRHEFAAEWIYAVEQDVFIHRHRPHIQLSESRFDHQVRPFSDVVHTSRHLRRSLSSQVDSIVYRPAADSGVLIDNGQRKFNVYRPASIKPTPVPCDPSPFIDFMAYLIPDERDRQGVFRWVATLLARPDIRMTFGLLMISETQGVGKTTLGEHILTPLLGRHNVSFPSEKDVTSSDFNGWLPCKRLAVVNEIYAAQNYKAYDQMKSIIADPTVRVNEKHEKPYDAENWIHVYACSNSKRALRMDDQDRRWMVPGLVEQKRPPEYWVQFRAWLSNNGLAIILRWAECFLMFNEAIGPGEHAPMTETKRNMIDDSRTPGAELAYHLGKLMMSRNKHTILEDRALVAWVKDKRPGDPHIEGKDVLVSALKRAGPIEASKRYRAGPRELGSSRVFANYPIPADAKWAELKHLLVKPEDLLQELGVEEGF